MENYRLPRKKKKNLIKRYSHLFDNKQQLKNFLTVMQRIKTTPISFEFKTYEPIKREEVLEGINFRLGVGEFVINK